MHAENISNLHLMKKIYPILMRKMIIMVMRGLQIIKLQICILVNKDNVCQYLAKSATKIMLRIN